MKHIDKMRSPIYSNSDKQVFFTELANFITLVASKPDDKGLQARAKSILGALKIKAEKALSDSGTTLLTALETLSSQATNVTAGIEAGLKIKGLLVEAGDVALRHQVPWKAVNKAFNGSGGLDWESIVAPAFSVAEMQLHDDLFTDINAILAHAIDVSSHITLAVANSEKELWGRRVFVSCICAFLPGRNLRSWPL